jgi:glutathione S-transferase
MKLYGHPMSTCTRKVLAIFAEKGVAPDFQMVDFAKGEHKQPPHVALQPFGQIPAIDDEGFVLYESRAILRYLDGKLAGASFTPKDDQGRARMEQWISVETSNFTPHAMKIVWERMFNPMFGKPTNEETVTKAREDLVKVIAILETQLGKTAYLAGDEPTLADIGYLPYIEYLFASNVGDLITSSPNVSRWWTAMSTRPAWQKAIGKS